MLKSVLSIVVGALLLSGCSTASERLRSHPGYQSSFWALPTRVRFVDRVSIPSDEILTLIQLQTEASDEPRFPKQASSRFSALIEEIKETLKELPPKLTSYLDDQFYGIFLVENLGRTGFAFYTYDGDEYPTGGWIVLDADRIDHNASDWFNEHEQMPYGSDSTHTFKVNESSKSTTAKRDALRWILVHELGHILSVVYDQTGRYKVPDDFFDLSWDRSNKPWVSKFEPDFFRRDSLQKVLIDNPILKGQDPFKVMGWLASTNFITLYG